MPKSLDHFNIADGFIYQARLLAPDNRLEFKHGIGLRSDEVRHNQRQWGNTDNHQCDTPVNPYHKEQSA